MASYIFDDYIDKEEWLRRNRIRLSRYKHYNRPERQRDTKELEVLIHLVASF